MAAEKEIIVAIEFGTSAIRGIAGRKKPDGTILILGIEQERTEDSIHKGVIYNIDKTTQAISNIAERLGERLGVRVKRAYVGLGGQSLHTTANFIARNLEMKVKITPELVDNLMDNNRATEYPEAEILEVIPQEYIVGNHSVPDAVGIQSDQIEARFMNVVARTVLRENIEKCMRMAGLEIADLYIAPLVLADALLSDSEKRSGCALVDFGAGTTTVAVYNGNLLRHLAVIPLGGNNLTNDLATCKQMEAEEAEGLKRKFGIAHLATDAETPRMIPISNDRSLNENELQHIIGARQEEIILNVWNQIKNYSDKLLAGIITTGGAVQIKDMSEAVKHYTKFERVKTAKSLVTFTEVAPGVVTPQGHSTDTIIAMLMRADGNCVAPQVLSSPEVEPFEEDLPASAPEPPTPTEEPKPKKPSFGDKVKTLWGRVSDLLQESEEE